MSFRFNEIRSSKLVLHFVVGMAMLAMSSSSLLAQGNFNNFQNNIGGISIDANGVIQQSTIALSPEIRAKLLKNMKKSLASDIETTTQLRMVSLKGLEQAIANAINNKEALPEEVEFMAGLQRIEFIFMDPESNDVVIAGPAEGWVMNEQGNIVGKTTGAPVIRLEDFLTALRTVENARRDQGISVSINPTKEGIQNVQELFRQYRGGFSPERDPQIVENAMGAQTVALTGMPTDSRFAQVLVAADYRMKRLAMGFEPSPVSKMPSFLELCKKKGFSPKTLSPRFWMECNYKPLARSADGLSWQLRGSGVRTLTEDDYISAQGDSTATGKSSKLAQKWADTMTEKFEELAARDTVFRELRNVMDMAVVSALISKENMLERVNLELPMMLGQNGFVKTATRNVARQVPSQCSFVRLAKSWLITCSGGVQVDSWSVVEKNEVVASVADTRSKAITTSNNNWYWNAP